ncbi:MAG: cellulase family glycosylhydrolase [Spirochaetales bacterium]|nr:cellulase family glycosylhydrolase [Spirochaetales bacterium]
MINKKNFLVLLLLAGMLISLFGAPYGDLQIVNNTLSDVNGKAIQLKGWSQLDLMQADTAWVPGSTIPNLKALCPNLNAVRLAMYTEEFGFGYMEQNASGKENYRNRIKALINDAIAANIYVVVDWHILNDKDPWSNNYYNESRAFFEDIAQTFSDSDNILFELCNEPKQVSFTGTIKPYAEHVLAGIRKYSDNIVIVGTPTWSQDIDQVVGNKISSNLGRGVMYALHFYAATHYQWLRDKGQNALNGGVPVMLSEWGTVSASGDGSIDLGNSGTWMDWADQHNISWFNWSWSVRRESSASISNGSLSGPWSSGNLSQSGQWVLNRLNSWNTPPPVVNETPTPYVEPPTPTPTATAYVNNCQGDVNRNGTVDIVDALQIARYYVGLIQPEEIDLNCANVNCDGNINIVDALLIAQYYVGLINGFC